MDIHASIIDQQVRAIAEKHPELFPQTFGEEKRVSAAFVLLCVNQLLDISLAEAADCLTEGSNDFSVDAMHIGGVSDGEFRITLFQGKYHRSLEGNKNFSENAIKLMSNALRTLFDPDLEISMNPALAIKVEEVRSLIRDGVIPNMRVVFCSNGIRWNDKGAEEIQRVQKDFRDQAHFEYLNHQRLVEIIQRTEPTSSTFRLQGECVVEALGFRRVLIGRVPLSEIRDLFDKHGNKLLERNVRRYLGLRNNRVNAGIRDTLCDVAKRGDFYFFNNGITMICSKFRHNAGQREDSPVQVEDMQIINGGQTCRTIQSVLNEPQQKVMFADDEAWSHATVMLRLYELPPEESDFIQQITYATNSQNPVDMANLRANDKTQKRLELDAEGLGYIYRRKQEGVASGGENVIMPKQAAEAIHAIWNKRPHQAKFRSKELFGKLYDEVFTDDLTAAEMIIAVLILRKVERKRRKPDPDAPPFISYASYFLAMFVGLSLPYRCAMRSGKGGDTGDPISHENFRQAKSVLSERFDKYYAVAIQCTQLALTELYGEKEISLQQLAATFRRGDLLVHLAEGMTKHFQNNNA